MRRELSGEGPAIAVRAPAKVNLFLAVRGLRPDGYHELVTVMQTVSLYDRLRIDVVAPPGRAHHPATRRRMRIELVANAPGALPPASDNLAVRAAELLGRSTGMIRTDVEPIVGLRGRKAPRTVIQLHKQIPVAGGMAGGSADAAATLLALNELWGTGLGRDDLRRIAAELGSDVPFCVVGGTALATGTGAALAQVLCRGTFHWVVCTAEEPLPTASVYAAWDARCRPSEMEPDAVLAALRTQDPEALGAALHNDLQPAAFSLRPALVDQRRALLDAGALGAVLSGSGPTMLALVETAERAHALAERVRPLFASAVVAQSPAGGPDLQHC